jgi:hypothetical protein
MAPLPPVVVVASSGEAAQLLADLMGAEYGAVVAEHEGSPAVMVRPVDAQRRTVVVYRAIQASRSVVKRIPEAKLYLLTEEGSRWRLPPPDL